MVEVSRYDGGIKINGHARYAEAGKDIVCAAVSILTQTLIESIEQMTTDEIQYSISPGAVDIKHGNLQGISATLVDSFFIGIQMIADEYPNNVRVTKH